jgi:type I restriction enzyme S subunit
MTGVPSRAGGGDTPPSPPYKKAWALKPYPEYKDSGVEWIGKIPNHWQVMPGRACYYEKNEPNTGLKEKTVLSLSYGNIVVKPEEKLHGLIPESFETYQIIDPGDIVIRPTDLQNDWNSLRFGIAHNRGIITSAYLCFRTKEIIERNYGHLLLHTYDLNKVFYGLGSGLRQNLDWTDFKYLPCLVPPLAEQEAIVRYYRWSEQQIHHLISAKRRLIELLNERKQGIISRTVTQGLDPNVRLKPSGIEWLGDVPDHWEVIPLRRYFDVIDCKHLTVPFFEDGVPLASVREVQKFDLDLSNAKRTSQHYYELLIQGGRNPHRGDIIYCRNASVGAAAYVNTDKELAMGQDVCLIRSDKQNTRFLNYQLNYWIGKQQLNTLLIGSTIKRMNVADIKNLIVLQPPEEEQDKIVEFLDTINEEINQSISSVKFEIEKIREYHARFISDLVTGKVDVPNIKIDEIPVTRLDENGEDQIDEDMIRSEEDA